MSLSKNREQKYFVAGMHCPSCEILIEKELLALPGIKAVEASLGQGEVIIEYKGAKPEIDQLNQLFKKDGYSFAAKKIITSEKFQIKTLIWPLLIGLLIILGFLGLNTLGLAELVNVNSRSSLPAFFLFGVIAGLSSCLALVGGLVLSLSKQWATLASPEAKTSKKIKPHFLFNLGRLLSYTLFGALLGAIGAKIQISAKITPFLVILISLVMILLAIQMLGVKSLRRFTLRTPKFLTRNIADESKFHGRYAPFLLGALTFFLPCGFTLTAQGLAILTGSALQGALIMAAFALGTLPMLLILGFSSVKFVNRPHLSTKIFQVAGVIVFLFALFNLNSQFNLLGWPSLSDLSKKAVKPAAVAESDLPAIVEGKQVLKMNASSSGYSPKYFKVRSKVPVRFEIRDTGTSGCTNAVIAQGLFEGQVDLTPGKTSIKEFTPEKTGKYKFSCWMGMISGIIEVVDQNDGASAAPPVQNTVESFTTSGAEEAGGSCSSNGICGCRSSQNN